ncbi:hypothetical protein ACNKHX_05495 [Shigella flexneri]
MTCIRLQAGKAMGLGDVSNMVIPETRPLLQRRKAGQLMYVILCRILAIARWR